MNNDHLRKKFKIILTVLKKLFLITSRVYGYLVFLNAVFFSEYISSSLLRSYFWVALIFSLYYYVRFESAKEFFNEESIV